MTATRRCSERAHVWLSRRALGTAAALLALLILAVNVVNAAACFARADAPQLLEHLSLTGEGTLGGADECDEKVLLGDGVPKGEDSKQQPTAVGPVTQARVPQDDFLHQRTRGAAPPGAKAPLFLQTGRLRN